MSQLRPGVVWILVLARQSKFCAPVNLRNIKWLEIKENKLKSSIEAISKKEARYTDLILFTGEIVSLRVGIPELIGLEVAIKERAKTYNLPFYPSTVRLIDDIKTLNKINGLKRELDRLSLQKYALDQACARQSQSLIALANLKSNGITERQDNKDK